MTVSNTNTDFAAHGLHGLWDGIRNFFGGLAAGYRGYLTYTRLDAMSDARLATLGLPAPRCRAPL